jgi:dihydropteroate synthase
MRRLARSAGNRSFVGSLEGTHPVTNRPQAVWRSASRVLYDGGRPRVMGIVNVTPDSFSDGGGAFDANDAIARGQALVAEGADIVDVGGESTRPGAEPVPLDEELRRVIPVVAQLAATYTVPISVDTMKAEVARRALEAGASIVNDVSGLIGDPEMARVVIESGAAVVLMHMAGTPLTMQIDPRYDDVVENVRDWLARRADEVEALGVPRSRIALDPGIGFGKTHAHNWELLRKVDRFASLGCVVLVGASRKGFLGKATGRPVAERDVATAVSSLAAATKGARVLRVHNVGVMVDALKVWEAQVGWVNDERVV